MVFRGELLTRRNYKFKTEYLLIWQKYLSTWTSIKYFVHQVQVSTKYFWISKGQVQVSTKYSIIRIKYQVPSTSTLLDTNPATMPTSLPGDHSQVESPARGYCAKNSAYVNKAG